jgi:D-sedoheptulose 7-phosphate isomerase
MIPTQSKAYFLEAQEVLNAFIMDDSNFERIQKAIDCMVESIIQGGKIISAGNGGSMSDAMHFAEELTGRFRNNRKGIPAIAISDPAFITCAANDYGYEEVFSRFISSMGNKNDVFLAISTSGNSANIIKAIESAKQNGMKVIGLTGKDGGQMKDLVDIEIRAPFSQFSDHVQEIHIKVIHSFVLGIETALEL